ncbi:MBL fold metallo-hydrolase [Candidatus Woesearchaeota archaeon]|nr:MBL fold metallo-hydrolase [Candidatus Woesearchaeota archaeon]
MGVKISAIIFLGTGGDTYVVGKQIRASGGIILQINENQFHIDPGPGSLLMAKEVGVNLRANTALFVSHNHLNHCNDVNAVIDAMTYAGFDKKGVLIANNTVVNGSQSYRPILQEYYKNCLERYIVLNAGQKVGINEVEIMALKARHSEENAIGFKFFTPQFTLSYSGDTKYNAEIADQYQNSNILILNVPYLKKEKDNDGLSKEDAVKIINAVKPRLAIITHFGMDFVKADPLYEIREIQKETSCQVIAAKDGMVVNPLSYSVEQGQRTLIGFKEEKRGVHVRFEEKVKEVDEILEEKQTSLEEAEDKEFQ